MTKANPHHDDARATVPDVPRVPSTVGDPEEIVPVQVKMPRWMKVRALECAKAEAKDLSHWVRGLFLQEFERQDDKAEKKPR